MLKDMRPVDGGNGILLERKRFCEIVHPGPHVPLSAKAVLCDQPECFQRLAKVRVMREPGVPRTIHVQPARWSVRTTAQIESLPLNFGPRLAGKFRNKLTKIAVGVSLNISTLVTPGLEQPAALRFRFLSMSR